MRGTARKNAAAGKPALTAERIAQVALEIIDAEGLDELSMRKVALRLGTGPASLYAHVENKEALLDRVLDLVIAEVEVPDPEPERWQEQLKEVMRSQHEVFRRHRDIAKVALARVPSGEAALPVLDRSVGLLRAAGLPDHIVGLAPDLTGLYVSAVSLEESMWGPDLGEADVQAFTTELREYFESLPADRFPNLVAMAGPLTEPDPVGSDVDRRFEFALEVIVRGIASLAEEG
jgi:AcrR family transcriptional regulator